MLYLSEKFKECYRYSGTPQDDTPQLPTMYDRRCLLDSEGREWYYDASVPAWFPKQGLTEAPIISGPDSVNEGEEQSYNIDNYNASYTYTVSVSHGSYTRSGAVIDWSFPLVNADTQATLTVTAQGNGLIENSTSKDVTIQDVPVTDDQQLVIDATSDAQSGYDVVNIDIV